MVTLMVSAIVLIVASMMTRPWMVTTTKSVTAWIVA